MVVFCENHEERRGRKEERRAREEKGVRLFSHGGFVREH
jgi:hypothetical protein